MSPSPKPLVRALQGIKDAQVPFWLMRQAGRYLPEYRELRSRAKSFLHFCLDPDLAAEATVQPIRRFAMDGAIIFSDILVIPHALGQPVKYVEGEGPVLDPVRTVAALDRFETGEVRARLAPVCETIRRVRAAVPPACAVLGFAGAPWTVAAYMVEGHGSRDFEAAKSWAYRAPEEFDRLIGILVEATVDYLGAQIDAGADAVQLFDSWAGVMPDGAFDRWCVKPVAEIIRRIKQTAPDVPVIAFPRCAGLRYAGFAKATGADAVSLDTTVPRAWACSALGTDSALQGNLDPVHLVVGGKTLEREVRRVLDDLGGAPLVFNLGHGVIPPTPPENVALLAETVRKWRR
jgi:uroporphyrinogen decarboxylase